MIPLIASTYGPEFYLLIFGWPLLNWVGAISAIIGVFAREWSIACFAPSAITVLSALWVGRNILLHGGPVNIWQVAGVFMPAAISIAAAAVAFSRARKRAHHDHPDGQ